MPVCEPQDAVQQFLEAASAYPLYRAVVDQGKWWTYQEVAAKVRRYAASFAKTSAPAIMIALPQGVDAYAAMLAAGLAGGFYAPLNLGMPLQKLLVITRQLQPDIILATPPLLSELAPAAPLARCLEPAEISAEEYQGAGSRHTLAYVIFTSGTTGTPKGVMIPREALDHYLAWVATSATITAGDRVAQYSNIAFDVSVTDIYGALCRGATLYPVVGRTDRLFPARMVARERITVWNSTPSVFSLMMQAGEVRKEMLGSLRLINFCGEPLLATHVDAVLAALPDTILQNSYGPTETTVTMTELRLDRRNQHSACRASVAIGQPIAGMAIHLVGGSHPDEGEIVITGPQLASGYWNDEDTTKSSFRAIDVDGRPVRGYHSGDWGERRDGYLFFRERIDLQVKLHGFRLELDEVARAINDQGYPVACVLKWRDELAAVIENPAGKLPDEMAFRNALAQKLESHALPQTIRWVDHMPRTHNDKLDRRAVAEWLDAVAAENGLER